MMMKNKATAPTEVLQNGCQFLLLFDLLYDKMATKIKIPYTESSVIV